MKQSVRKSFLVLISLLLVLTAVPWSAAADGAGSNGNYVLKVETTGGNQWDGAQIGIDALGLQLGSTYTFTFDLYTPDKEVDGIVLQSSGSYTWIRDTGAFDADDPGWATYSGDFAFTNSDDVGKHIQFVKKGGATEAANITYYIDNFVVREKESGTVVYSEDFESNAVGAFGESGSAVLSVTAPPVINYFLQIETTGGNQWDGAQIPISVTNLVYGSTYTFSFDLYTPDKDVDGIILQSNGSYTWIADTGPLQADNPGWATYSGDFAFTNSDDVGKHIQFVKKGGATEAANITYYIDNFVVKEKESGTVVFSEDFEDRTVGGFSESGDATLTVVNRITATPTPPPPVSDEVVIAYNLQWDVELPNFVSYGGSRYLQKAGPSINAVGRSDGSVYLDLSNRTERWHGVDVRSSTMGLRAGSEYTIEVKGRIPDDIEIPEGAQIILGGAGSPYADVATVDATRSFTLTYSGTAQANTGETTGLRIQADVAVTRFFIDSIIVQVKGGNAMPEGVPDIGVPDDYEWPEPAWDLSLPSLKEAYKRYFHIGNIIEPGQTADETLTAMFKKQYNVVTAENAMKPDAMLGGMSTAGDLSDPDKYNFEAADLIVEWAENNGLLIHGHTLVWHAQTPAFINTGDSGTREAARANMEIYINHVIKHFDSPSVISWDVVNEAFDDDVSKFDGKDWRTGLRTNSPWYIAYANGADESKGESGADFIYDAFVFAHLAQAEIGSTAKLYYNDYNETFKYEQIAQMAEDLNARWEQDPRYDGRKLIEGIGMQSHFWIGQLPEVVEDEVVAVIERFIEAGVKISVSELDIPYADNKGYHLDEARQALQAEKYATLFKIYKKYADHIERVTFWGNADSMSWRSSGMPLLFDNSYRPKAAFYAVLNLGDRPSSGSSSSGGGGSADPAGSGDGKIELSADDLNKALSEAKDGDGILKLQLSGTEDAEQVHVSIPAEQLNAVKEAGVNHIEISSGLAAVRLPVSLLADVSDNIELNIDLVESEALSEEQQALVGSNSVLDIQLSAGEQPIADVGQGAPVRIAVPYTLAPGENESQIVIYRLSDDGKVELVKNGRYNKETGMVEFNAKHFGKYAAIANPVTFSDAKAVAWARESIEGLAARNIVSGMSKDSFAPDKSVTRAEFIQMLILALDLNQPNASSTFSDAKRGAWYYNAVASAEQLGIVSGLTDGSFGIHNEITRQEMAAMAYRAIQKAGIALTQVQAAEFRDAQDIADYAKEAVTAMHEAGIIQGVGSGQFNPKGTATRAEAAVILYQLLMKSL